MSHSAQQNISHAKYRPDIDGLRAIAVLSVVIFHAFPHLLKGGFTGVDIFFVISGFLISGIILKNVEHDSFSFTDFYGRRIRRIFPALLLVLIASYIFGWFVLTSIDYRALGKHTAGGATFISNFLLWGESGYFDREASTKPLLHLWSLGIEEQFYIIWPFLLILFSKKKFSLPIVILIVFALSFAFNLTQIQKNGLAAFYAPWNRFWELMLGGMVSWLTIARGSVSWIPKLTAWFSNILSWLGIFLILAGLFFIHKNNFPSILAVLPTLGAGFIIAAGENAFINRSLLSHPVLVWFGLISFPLYLWHWPLLSFLQIIAGQIPSVSIRIQALVISILLAWFTYAFVEKKIRFGAHAGRTAVFLCLGLFLCGSLGYFTYQEQGFPFRDISQRYDKAIAQNTAFVQELGRTRSATIMLLGDSHAAHLVPGLLQEMGHTVADYTEGGCIPFRDVDRYDVNNPAGLCVKKINRALNLFERSKTFQTIVLASMGSPYLTGESFKGYGVSRVSGLHVDLVGQWDLQDRWQIFRMGLESTVARLTAKGKHVIFVLDVPELGFEPVRCLVPLMGVYGPCEVPRWEYEVRTKGYKEIVYKALKNFPQVTVFDASKLFCNETSCSAKINGEILYRDADHLNNKGSMYVAKFLAPVIKKIDKNE